MQDQAHAILTINCGSSSVKFALYHLSSGAKESEALAYAGLVERIGLTNARLSVADGAGRALADQPCAAPDHAAALDAALAWLAARPDGRALDAIGHRVVHGGADYRQPTRIDDATLTALRRLAPLAPLHLPIEIDAIETLRQRYPALPQVACFDTAFHHTMPPVAQTYGLAQEWRDKGVRRYGFHGLSYEYILNEVAQSGPVPSHILIAHLGNGASMVAVRNGRSVETTMGFTPTGGLVMSSRSGDLDPGVLLYLLESGGLTAQGLRDAVEHDGGLRGVSGSSDDMRDLFARATGSPADLRAEAAIELFCYTARKYLGSLIAVLGSLDLLVFTGGIGEHMAEVRRRICAGLDGLGLRLDIERNTANSRTISVADARVAIQVIPTNEDVMIARHTARLLGFAQSDANHSEQ
jgi:acetate kinase